MHKSTIFLAILAFFSITILLESQLSSVPSAAVDQLQANSVYFQTPNTQITSNSSDLQTNSDSLASKTKTDFNYNLESQNTDSNPSQVDTIKSPNENQSEVKFNAEFFKDFLKSDSDDTSNTQSQDLTSQSTNLNQPTYNSNLEKFFASIDIQDLEISKDTNQTLIFDTLDLSQEKFQSFVNYQYTKQNSLVAKGTEITFQEAQEADYFFTLLQAVSKSYQGIEINKNNQFQDSFYINNPSKPFFVSLVIKDRTKIYCFSYHKDIHEKFKSFYEILL